LSRLENAFIEHAKEDRAGFVDLNKRLSNMELVNEAQNIKLDMIDKRTLAIEASLSLDRKKRDSVRPPTFAEQELSKDAATRRAAIGVLIAGVSGVLGALAHYLLR
jgi:hypothetical protein